jgi:uncharacterized Zn-binding protein involved in type VI secretion
MFSILRVGDPVNCTCFPPSTGAGVPVPCPNGSVIQGSFDTFVEDRAVARVGDQTSNCCGGQCFCPNHILTGSFTTFVNDKGVARLSDTISCGVAALGSFRTYVG